MNGLRNLLWVAVALLLAFFAGWWLRGQRPGEVVVETVRVDTVYYEKPQPLRSSDRYVAVNIPRMLFAPLDTVYKTVIVERDSVQIEVPVRTQEYRDSTYYARVSGPVVGQLGPRLDWIETYDRIVTRTVAARRNDWEVGPAAGAWFAPKGGGLWVGGQVRRDFGRLSLSGTLGYDTHNVGAYGQISIGVIVWRSVK